MAFRLNQLRIRTSSTSSETGLKPVLFGHHDDEDLPIDVPENFSPPLPSFRRPKLFFGPDLEKSSGKFFVTFQMSADQKFPIDLLLQGRASPALAEQGNFSTNRSSRRSTRRIDQHSRKKLALPLTHY